MDIDWKSAGRDTVLTGLEYVPEVGGLLSGLVGLLWPESGTNVWSEIRADVEQLVDKKLSDEVYTLLAAKLDGLKNAVSDYLIALMETSSQPEYILGFWITTNGLFSASEPMFRIPSHQILLLPLYAQFVNLRLALLQDVIQNGKAWNITEQNIAKHQETLEKFIAFSCAYAAKIDQLGYSELVSKTSVNEKTAEPFRSTNRYSREMTLMVRDYAALWPYFNKAKYPGGPPSELLDREIFSDPFGQPGAGRSINLPTVPSASPVGMIRGMQIWGDQHLTGIRVAYSEGGGPGGALDTGRMGAPDGYGSDLPPRGGRFQVTAENPVTGVSTRSGLILDGCQFHFEKGDSTREFGGGTGVPGGCSYPQHVLSSVHVTGWDIGWRSVECAVFGFKLATDKPNAAVLARFAVTSPRARSPAISDADFVSVGETQSLHASRASFALHLRNSIRS